MVVSGVSGAGKSSLLRAGVLPRVRAGALAAPGSASWPRLVLTPTANPLDELAERVAPIARADAATIRRSLAGDPGSFALTARQAASAQAPGLDSTAGRLLLVVDQFEQMFTHCEDDEQRRAFVNALHAATNGAGSAPAAVVTLVVRADFETRCAEYPELTAAVQDRYLVTSMTERQLRLAITEPAKQAGAQVEDGLAEVLLHEMAAATSAGSLPLLSHALDQAWRERTGQALTLADYERTGGIEGALARSAQRAYQRLTSPQQETARRVFTRLVATSGDGVDTADRVRRAELARGDNPGDVEKVLETFADARLVTLAADTVEISHEALLTAWPLLRDTWLEEVHGDRMVHARLRLAADEWNRSRRDRSYLYQGDLLDTATEAANRVRTDPRHLPLRPVEDDFLLASAQAHRLRVRTRRLVIAVLTVLALAAAALSVAASIRGGELSTRLQAANAETLGRESQSRAPADISTAAQLALAAWRSDPTSPQARTALANAYLAMPTLDAEITELTTAPIKDVWVRGDTAVLTARPLTVVTGITGPAPQRWEIPNLPTELQGDLSPDGRWFAYLTKDGTLRVRDILTRAEPMTVATGQQQGFVKFSPDGKRLAWLTDSAQTSVVELRICELAECVARHPEPRPLPADRTVYGFWLTPDPNRVLVRDSAPSGRDSRLVVRSVADGSELAVMAPDAAVARDGATLVSCEPAQGSSIYRRPTMVVTQVDGSVPAMRFSSVESICSSHVGLSTDGGWLVEQDSAAARSHGRLRLTDLGSGTKRWVSVPALELTNTFIGSARALGVSTVTGQPSALVAHGTSLLRMRTEPGLTDQEIPRSRQLMDGDRYLSLYPDTPTRGQGTFAVEDRATGRRIAAVEGLPPTTSAILVGNSMWLHHPVDGRVETDRYDIVPLTKATTFVAPGPALGGPGTLGGSGFGAHFATEGSTTMMLAVSGGVLSALDAMTGRLLAAPVTLGPPEEFDRLFREVGLTARPGRPPGQVAVTGARDVKIWDALTGREVATIPVRPWGTDSVAFDPTGQRIAILTNSKTIELWSVEPANLLQPPIPMTDGRSLVGFDAEGNLCVLTGNNEARVTFVDLASGREAGSMDGVPDVNLRLTAGDPHAPVLGVNGELPYDLPLTARAWHDRLCSAANRPFTKAERDLLPPGADDSPPCS
nr:hypothetical protein [Pseudonocardia acaciae]